MAITDDEFAQFSELVKEWEATVQLCTLANQDIQKVIQQAYEGKEGINTALDSFELLEKLRDDEWNAQAAIHSYFRMLFAREFASSLRPRT
jgi:hypothetical protein